MKTTKKPEDLRRKHHECVRSIEERMLNVSDFAMEVWIEGGKMLGLPVRIVCGNDDYSLDVEFAP